jgi:hypothetical protein
MAKQEEVSFETCYRTTRGYRDIPDVGDVYYDDRMHVLHVVMKREMHGDLFWARPRTQPKGYVPSALVAYALP